MRAKTVKGMIITPFTTDISNVTIRVEKTGKIKGMRDNFTSVSLTDDKRGIMIQVDYDEIKKLIKGL